MAGIMKSLRSRFQKEANKAVENYTASVSFDHRLYRQDIAGSIAHARMLGRQGIITAEEVELIVAGLISIREEIECGDLKLDQALEDIHMNIESRLFEKIGDVAGKLHTARSRNDQVATDMRLFAKEALSETVKLLREFQRALLDLAETNAEVIIPGYTHLQRAQPVLLAHHLLAYFEMFQRDVERFGVSTHGKGSMHRVHRLSNGGALYITFARWFTPDGRQIDREGIAPDIELELTPEDIENNRDPQLERAIEYLQRGK
ncbi:lyase family protein [Dehalococcoidia bacterium]|nr:lyase family protein [Dehalococcoidia bacterium]